MKGSCGSECVRFKPPLPASRNLRPTEGMASYRCTATPALASTSAAIRPAGPPPTTTTGAAPGSARDVADGATEEIEEAAEVMGADRSEKGQGGRRRAASPGVQVCVTPALPAPTAARRKSSREPSECSDGFCLCRP